MNSRIILILILGNICFGAAFKPVVLIHGILTGAESMLIIEEEIKRVTFLSSIQCTEILKLLISLYPTQHHPGTKVYVTNRFSGWSSLENGWHQVDEMGQYVMDICRQHPEGIHLLGYSQGGLMGRAILQSFPEHNVQTFISLSSPQAGQYGSKS